MPTVGEISIGMTTYTDAMERGFKKAEQVLTTAGKSMASSIEASLSRVDKSLGSTGGMAASFGTGMMKALGPAALAMGGLAIAAGAGLIALASSMAKVIDETGDAADRLGTTTAALSELRYAAKLTGSDSEALIGALQKLNSNLGDATVKGGPTAEALKTIGLSAKDLTQIDPTDAFKKVVKGFQSIPNPAERSAIAMDLFGKTGTSLLNTLSAGPAELDRLAGEFKKFGGSVTESQRQAVGAMFDSIDKIGAIIQGLGTQLAVQLSPFITAAAEEFAAMATSGESMGVRVSAGLESVAMGLAKTGDVANGVYRFFASIGPSIVTMMDQMVRGVLVAFRRIAGVFQNIPGLDQIKAGLDKTIADIDKSIVHEGQILNALDGKSWSSEVAEGFARIRDRAKETASAVKTTGGAFKGMSADMVTAIGKLEEMEKDLISQVATFGKSGREAQLYKLQLSGISPAVLANARSLSAQLTAMEKSKAAFDKLFDNSAAIIEEAKTPLEKYKETINKIGDSLALGLINEKQAKHAKGKAAGELDKATEVKFAGSMELGSKEARSTILKATTGRTDGLEPIAKAQLQQQSHIATGIDRLIQLQMQPFESELRV